MKRILTLLLLIPILVFASTFKIDDENAYAEISYQSDGLNNVIVRLGETKGDIEIDDGKLSNLDIKINLRDLSSGNKDRDQFLKEKVLNTKDNKYLYIKTLKSQLTPSGPVLLGNMVLNRKMKTVSLPVNVIGPKRNDKGQYLISLSTSFTFSLVEFGILQPSESFEDISKTLTLNLEFRAEN